MAFRDFHFAFVAAPQTNCEIESITLQYLKITRRTVVTFELVESVKSSRWLQELTSFGIARRTASCMANPNFRTVAIGLRTPPAAMIIPMNSGRELLGRKVGRWIQESDCDT